MFKKHAIQVKLINTKNNENVVENNNAMTLSPEKIAEIATDSLVKTIGMIGAVIAANKVLTAACDVVVIVAKAKIK